MKEDIYKGHAYSELESTEELDGFNGSTIKKVSLDATCHYCGLVKHRKRRGFVIL